MSQGRNTQIRLNILTALTLAAAIALILSLITFHTVDHPLTIGLFVTVVVLGLVGVYAHRCPKCGHDVTKDARGVRTHKSWPKVNETCASCGTEIS
jgi:hypothetical protein